MGLVAWLVLLPQIALGEDLAEKERALQERVAALRTEIQSLEEELATVRKQRALADLDKAVITFSSSSLCLYDEFPQGHTRCKPGPPGSYRILEYIHPMRLSKVLTPDDRIAFALVGYVDLPNGPALDQFRLLVERETEAHRNQEDARVAEAARAALLASQQEDKRRAERKLAAAEVRSANLRTKYAGSPYLETILSREVSLGMSDAMVRDAWGAPDDIHRTILPDVTKEQWVYGLQNFVYLECRGDTCVVTAIQN